MNKNLLFDDNELYTAMADDLNLEVMAALKPIFDKYVKVGCPVRDVQSIVDYTANDLAMNHLLDKG